CWQTWRAELSYLPASGSVEYPGRQLRLFSLPELPRMPQDLPQPDPAIVLDLLEAFRRSKTMFAAVALGVFDALASGPESLHALADELKLNADALERLLDACVGLELLGRDGQGYRNTPVAMTYLCQS